MSFTTLLTTIFLFQAGEVVTEPLEQSSWWKSFVIGESYSKDWLWFLIGALFSVLICYVIYSSMLYNQVAANRHPANFRKLVISLGILLAIIWFGYVFSHAFGLPILGLLLAVWLVVAGVFYFTRRKGALPQV